VSLDSKVRILPFQQGSQVSELSFLGEEISPTFPRASLVVAGLWPAISGISVATVE